MNKIIKTSRLVELTAILAALSAVVLIALYRLQIIEGAAYAAQAKNSIVTTTTVAAARGNILDRYGRVLVTNRTCNNLIINSDELFAQGWPEANAIILEIARTITDAGDTYTDDLPVTRQAPFEYIAKMTDIQRQRLDKYLDNNDLLPSTSAVELMAFFRDRYKIDAGYTSEEMRIIAGIRYEINNRYVLGADYVFAEDVSIDLITRLMENDIPGFQVVSSFVREYNTSAAPHILGYVSMIFGDEYQNKYKDEGYALNALVGREGIEKAFEDILHGTDGAATVISTKGGTVISTEYTKEVVPGNNVAVTIDIAMQEVAENALASYIANENAIRAENNAQYEGIPGFEKEIKDLITGGGVVAVQIGTGEPLAIASYPGFDVSKFLENYTEISTAENAPLFNRALQGTYAPGSTFKPVTAIAALASGTITTTTTVEDKGIYTELEDESYRPTCWIYPHGTHGVINVTEAIKVSCNYFFYDTGRYLGIDRLSTYAKRFGLGVHSGIELDENTGNMSTQESAQTYDNRTWFLGDTLQAAIGQSFSLFTPLQLANYAATLAGRGARYETSILKSVRSYDYSASLFERKPALADNIDVDQEFYDAVLMGMYQAANNAPGTVVYDVFSTFRVPVAAKTGTAQLGKGVTNNGVFICFAPYDKPEIAIAVVVEKGGAGSAVAEIAKVVLEYYFSFKNSTITIESENSLLK